MTIALQPRRVPALTTPRYPFLNSNPLASQHNPRSTS